MSDIELKRYCLHGKKWSNMVNYKTIINKNYGKDYNNYPLTKIYSMNFNNERIKNIINLFYKMDKVLKNFQAVKKKFQN